jgi:cell division protein FtsL
VTWIWPTIRALPAIALLAYYNRENMREFKRLMREQEEINAGWRRLRESSCPSCGAIKERSSTLCMRCGRIP